MRTAAALTRDFERLGFRVIEGGKSGAVAVLTTVGVAEIFALRHDNVLRDVRRYQAELPSNLRAAFADHCRPSVYKARDTTRRNCFELTNVGFVAIAAQYDGTLRFLLALAFNALECGNGGVDVVRAINTRSKELRSGKTGQNELNFEAADFGCTIQPDIEVTDDDEDDAVARGIWRRNSQP